MTESASAAAPAGARPAPSMAGKVAVVTGASRGIGLAIAQRFFERGAHVVIASRKAAAIEAAARSIDPGGDGVVAVAAHVADEDGARRCFQAATSRWGAVDVLVNNAATNPHFGPTVQVDRQRWDKIIEVNLWCPLAWTQLALGAGLGRERGGSVINISSYLSLAAGGPAGVYALSKAALNYLTQQLATELGPGVRVNALAPGVIDTQMSAMLVALGSTVSGGWPLPRFGAPSDIADAAEFLGSDSSSWVTGQVLAVDGGASLGRNEFDVSGIAHE